MLTGLLREQLSFHGLIVTDAMDMQGLTSMFDTPEASVRSLLAGADVLLMPRKAEDAINGVLAAVETRPITPERLNENAAQGLFSKTRPGLEKKKLVNLGRVADAVSSPPTPRRAP